MEWKDAEDGPGRQEREDTKLVGMRRGRGTERCKELKEAISFHI